MFRFRLLLRRTIQRRPGVMRSLRRTHVEANSSIAEPDTQFVKDQWRVKQAFALDADAESHKLLAAAA